MNSKHIAASAAGTIKLQRIDIAIIHGTILTMDASRRLIDDGIILISNGLLIAVEQFNPALLTAAKPAEIIDASGKIIIPGLINTHTHIGMSLFRTLGDDMPQRLQKFIFPLEKHFVTPELVYQASRHCLTEMISGGTTTIADMYYFQAMTARAVDESGIRGVLAQALSSAPVPDAQTFTDGAARLTELSAEYSDHSRIIPAAGPHAPYSLTTAELRETVRLAQELDIPIQSHLAEMPFEEELIVKQTGLRPIPYYDSLGMLSRRATMAHCIFANDEDRALMIKRETGIAHNPSANSKSGKGTAPAYEFYREGARIGLGTDGPMSGNRMDIVSQLNIAAKMQKIRLGDPTVMKPAEVLAMATIGGAEALHLEQHIGSLEKGKQADIVIVSTDSPSMFPIYDPYAALVYCAGSDNIESVLAAGKFMLKKRELKTLDREEIQASCTRITAKIAEGFTHAVKI